MKSHDASVCSLLKRYKPQRTRVLSKTASKINDASSVTDGGCRIEIAQFPDAVGTGQDLAQLSKHNLTTKR